MGISFLPVRLLDRRQSWLGLHGVERLHSSVCPQYLWHLHLRWSAEHVPVYCNGQYIPQWRHSLRRGEASDEIYADRLPGAFWNVVWLKYGARVSNGFGPLAVVTSCDVFLYEGSHTGPPI